MRRKRIKYKHLGIVSGSYADARYRMVSFLKLALGQAGLKPGKDYCLNVNILTIRHCRETTGKILITLKEVFPVFNFYWETPRVLVWF